MKFLTSIIFILLVAGGLTMLLGMINHTIENIGAVYYSKAVWVGYLLFAVIYIVRLTKGYELKAQYFYKISTALILGVVILPSSIPFVMPTDHWQGDQGVAWLITLGACSTIVSCGFTGTKTLKAPAS
tara:strand:+ start:2762 stop:3145 length:384 start_codon:yes stop_codon:yes gene_type:complete